jgi:hypothetical protein
MESSELHWSVRIPLVRNTIVIKQLTMALGGGFLFVLLLCVIFSPGERIQIIAGVGPILLMLFLFIVGLCFVVMIVLEAAMKGGIDAEFTIDKNGVEYTAGESSKTLNRLGFLGSALLRSSIAMGGSLISISRESQFIRWKDIRSITPYEGQHSILIRTRELVYPMGVFCTPENFSTALDLIRIYAPNVRISKHADKPGNVV